jgi:hypothetical protein
MIDKQQDKKVVWYKRLFSKDVELPESYYKLGMSVEEDTNLFFKDEPIIKANPQNSIKDSTDLSPSVLKEIKKKVNPDINDLIIKPKEKQKKKSEFFITDATSKEAKNFSDSLEKLEASVEYCKKNKLLTAQDWRNANLKMEKVINEFVQASISLADQNYEEQTALSMDTFSEKMYKKNEYDLYG